jgi:negative regulator of replication initiation
MLSSEQLTQIGSVSSILGVIISLAGFGLTLYNVRRSRTAANDARRAASEARDNIKRYTTVSDLSEAVRAMKEIKQLHRSEEWVLLPDRYDNLRELLISIKTNNRYLSSEEAKSIQGMIASIADIERRLDEARQKKTAPYQIPEVNHWINKKSETLYQTLVALTRG